MTDPLLKAAGITPDTPGHSAERDLLDAAWECVQALRDTYDTCGTRICCGTMSYRQHKNDCPMVAFDEAAKFFQEDV